MVHIDSQENFFAIKIVTKSKLSEEDEVALQDEIDILKKLEHPNIIRLFDVFDEKENYYLITEKMMGGELFDRIVQKTIYNEKEARDVSRILIEALRYCHERHIVHRDLKPENLLLASEDDDISIKIADFGFAKRCTKPKSLKTQCGTPGYVAPEILKGILYDSQADMWSLGVIIYILLGGYPPFIEENQRELFKKIMKGRYKFHDEYWSDISEDGKSLIKSLMCVDTDKRLMAEEALASKWMQTGDEALEGKGLGKNLAKFKAFNAKRKLKAAVSTIMAANKLASLGIDFKQLNLEA